MTEEPHRERDKQINKLTFGWPTLESAHEYTRINLKMNTFKRMN